VPPQKKILVRSATDNPPKESRRRNLRRYLEWQDDIGGIDSVVIMKGIYSESIGNLMLALGASVAAVGIFVHLM
jgi:hypothetical protein